MACISATVRNDCKLVSMSELAKITERNLSVCITAIHVLCWMDATHLVLVAAGTPCIPHTTWFNNTGIQSCVACLQWQACLQSFIHILIYSKNPVLNYVYICEN